MTEPTVKGLGAPMTPQLDKMLSVRNQSQPQGELLEWLFSQGYVLCEAFDSNDHPYVPVHRSIQDLLAQFHGIDVQEMERERMRVLEYVRSQRP